MFFRDHLALFISVAVAAASSSTTLCLQGCCGLQLDIPSSQLSFSNPSAKGQQAVISLQHSDTNIQCCPCDGITGNSENTTTILKEGNPAVTQNATIQGFLERYGDYHDLANVFKANWRRQLLATPDCGTFTTFGPGCPPGGCVHHIPYVISLDALNLLITDSCKDAKRKIKPNLITMPSSQQAIAVLIRPTKPAAHLEAACIVSCKLDLALVPSQI
jgi:hypothetical protein